MSHSANKIGVLVSGGGTNLQSIIDKIHFGDCAAEIECVVSNVADAYALKRADNANIPHHVISHKKFAGRAEFEQALIKTLDSYDIDIIVLAGFMRVLESTFISHYLGRILNIHPSLLPKYSGLNTHQRVLNNGDSSHGCSVHFATTELDGGPVILQASVPVLDNDDVEILAKRVLQQEHIIYPKCVQWLCENRIYYQDGCAYFDKQLLTSPLQLEHVQ
ncbi:MAG: phosphoribosylglycinamide formyltransferase [Gammaproteobacteria bacterium]|nr:phosphoribosylglycinamide formyltransferase [Gammaproteobacteria bacterium]